MCSEESKTHNVTDIGWGQVGEEDQLSMGEQMRRLHELILNDEKEPDPHEHSRGRGQLCEGPEMVACSEVSEKDAAPAW